MAAPLWQNLISHRTQVDPLELLPQVHNFRIHGQNQRQVTTASLDELGHVGDIIVNVRTGKIVNGHLRVELAIAEDQRTVPVTYLDCDEATEQIILAFFDEVGAKAITDGDRLRATIAKIDIGATALQDSLDEWVLALKPAKATKATKGTRGTERDEDEDEGDEDEDEGDEDVLAPIAPAPAPIAPASVAPAPAPLPAVADVLPAVADVLPVVADVPLLVVADTPTDLSPLLGQSPDDNDAPPAPLAPLAPPPVVPDAPPPPLPPLPSVVPTDAFAAALIADVQTAHRADAPPAPPTAPADAAPPAYLIRVGEYAQMVPASVFTPWFAALCAQVGTEHAALSAEVSQRLGLA